MLYLILDLIVPSRCVACGAPISFKAHDICRACIGRISFIHEQCPVCSGPLPIEYCEICSRRAFYLSRNVSLAEYRGVMKELLHALKFKGNRRLHKPIGDLAVREISRHNLRADIITCVPMNSRKKWKRGFNQSELIARFISKKTGIPFIALLKEERTAVTQGELGLQARFINAINRYDVRKKTDVKDKSVMIIDDIFTTGATINECARKLRTAGAKDVFSITIARSGMHRA